LSKKKPAKKGFWEKAKESASQQQTTAKRNKAEKTKPKDNVSESKPAAPVEKTPEEKKKNYKDGIIKTIVPALIGTAAGAIGIDVKEFGNKDWFYVEFITIDFWLVVWTLLLNPL